MLKRRTSSLKRRKEIGRPHSLRTATVTHEIRSAYSFGVDSDEETVAPAATSALEMCRSTCCVLHDLGSQPFLQHKVRGELACVYGEKAQLDGGPWSLQFVSFGDDVDSGPKKGVLVNETETAAKWVYDCFGKAAFEIARPGYDGKQVFNFQRS